MESEKKKEQLSQEDQCQGTMRGLNPATPLRRRAVYARHFCDSFTLYTGRNGRAIRFVLIPTGSLEIVLSILTAFDGGLVAVCPALCEGRSLLFSLFSLLQAVLPTLPDYRYLLFLPEHTGGRSPASQRSPRGNQKATRCSNPGIFLSPTRTWILALVGPRTPHCQSNPELTIR